MATQPTNMKDHLLVYRPQDNSVDFGTELIDAMRPLYTPGRTSPDTYDLAVYLAKQFPEETHWMKPDATCGHYLTVDPFNAPSMETLLVDCPGGLHNPFGEGFEHWGYQIFAKEERMEMVLGYQTPMPNDPLRNKMSDAEKLRYAQSMLSNIQLFPNHYVTSCNLQDIPNEEQFRDKLNSEFYIAD